MAHINHALVAKTHPPMYLMHKYWARKPSNVVRAYIEHYSEVGDIILDPFCGSGPTPIEAIKTGRKAVAVDLDPMAIFITECTGMPVDFKKFEESFDKIKDSVKEEIYALYKTKCEHCGRIVEYNAVIWRNDTPMEIRYNCTCQKNGKNLWKKVTKEDIENIEKLKDKKPSWFPDNELIWNTRVNVHRGTKVPDLFTERNLYALSRILKEIDGITNKKIRKMMLFVFSSALPQASKLVFVIRKRGRQSGSIKEEKKEVGSWATRGYWVPDEYFEINAWNCFENRFKKICRGKKQSDEEIQEYKEAKSFDDLKNDENILLLNQSSLDLSNIPSNSIDYVFTDPPYGDSIPYLELNYMWTSWLKFDVNFEDEIIISDSPVRNKNFVMYEKMLGAAFRQVYRVLKPEKYLTVTFHSTDIKIWNSIIKAVVMAGFDLEKIIYQPPARPSAKGLLHPYGSAVGDYYIRFRKTKSEKLVTEKEMDLQTYEREVISAAMRIIGERREPTIYQHILNGIMVELNGGRNVPIGARNIEEILKDHVGRELELIPIKDTKGKVIGEKWWVKGWDLSHFSQPALTDRVERAVIHVLDHKVKVSLDDILQVIFMEFPNALTPDTQNVKAVLEDYATKTKDGMWMLKPGYSEKERISQHSRMIYYLAQIGKKIGYEIWIGQREQGESYNRTRLLDLCDPLPTFRFIISDDLTLDRIKQIDVIWHESGRIKYVFEVENTTGITDAIIRGSNIRSAAPGVTLDIKKYIVIPESREALLAKKIEEPIIKESLRKDAWWFIRYDDLEMLYKSIRKGVSSADIERLGRMPVLRNQVQKNIYEFE
ncbi:MAG: DNA methyltransferase [Halobacteriota archaeon]